MTVKTKKALEINKTASTKHRILWFIGSKQLTANIMDELKKRNIHFRVLRDSYLRRDFLHFKQGEIMVMTRSEFKAAKRQIFWVSELEVSDIFL